ncbi:MAG: geranylgeranylglycerol-phosphate geranylgeranyltransferase [Bacteroidota bacterium]|nr:geranylgeranylglycerol-phosphate geranylgeranyltransferase [Bacteroidota bacterium]
MSLLQLIRFPNLLMLGLMQMVIYYGFLKKNADILALNDWQFLLLVLATIAIAAGGYIINDIYDKKADSINKPQLRVVGVHISESIAYRWYAGLNIIGVAIGFYLSNYINQPSFSAIFIVIAISLYMYASEFKRFFFVSNLLIAILLAMSVLIVGVYNLMPIVVPQNQSYLRLLFGVILDYAVFAFGINLIREIIKDTEDVEGDMEMQIKSLPIILGVKKTKVILSVFILILIGLLAYYTYRFFFENNLYFTSLYVLLTVLAPLVYILVELWNAREKKHFAMLSLITKIIMFFGIFTVLILEYER